jgi:hypothetical protein
MNQRISICAASLAVASALVTPTTLNSTAAAAPLCRTDSLSLSTGPYGAPGDNTQMHFAVILTNISRQSCTLQGYPGVDLVGPDGPTYSLPRQSGDPRPFTLAPGASASSRLTFLPTPNGWVPRTIVVTPPDGTTQLETPWIPGGIAVLRQDGATHPGTYIGPLELAD